MEQKLVGINSIMEALKGHRKIHKIYIQAGRQGKKIEELANYAAQKGVYVQYVEKQRLDKMYTLSNHQGIIAQVDDYEYASIAEIMELAAVKGQSPLILILDGLEDPQNLGSIIRTAEGAGVHGIIIPRHNSVEITAAVARASAGAVEYIKIVRETNIVNVIKILKENGLWVVGTDANAKQEYFKTVIPTPTAVVMGGEGKGIRRLVQENCDLLVNIPMFGQLESLNVSVATGLLIYEIIRQRQK